VRRSIIKQLTTTNDQSMRLTEMKQIIFNFAVTNLFPPTCLQVVTSPQLSPPGSYTFSVPSTVIHISQQNLKLTSSPPPPLPFSKITSLGTPLPSHSSSPSPHTGLGIGRREKLTIFILSKEYPRSLLSQPPVINQEGSSLSTLSRATKDSRKAI